MQKILSMAPSNRRLWPLLAAAALLAALFLTQLPGLRGVAASPRPSSIAINVPCVSAAVAGSPAQPAQPGIGNVTLTATSSACTSPEYKFLVLAPGSSTWVFKTGYTVSSTYSWNTTGALQGVWQIGVWVRQSGSTASYQTYAIGTYSLLIPYCTSAAISIGSTVINNTLDLVQQATATGCDTPEFEWWELAPGASTWVMVQPYTLGTLGGLVFEIDLGTPLGAYRFSAHAKQSGSSHKYDTYVISTIWWLG
jgi:hypothetical protein